MGWTKSWLIGTKRCVECTRKAKYWYETGTTGNSPSTYRTHYKVDSVLCRKHYRKRRREENDN